MNKVLKKIKGLLAKEFATPEEKEELADEVSKLKPEDQAVIADEVAEVNDLPEVAPKVGEEGEDEAVEKGIKALF